MSKLEKLIEKILGDRDISYDEAETLLLKLGFQLEVRSSHHIPKRTSGGDGNVDQSEVLWQVWSHSH